MAYLELAQKRVGLFQTETEIRGMEAKTTQVQVETQKSAQMAEVELGLKRAELERMMLENEQKKIDVLSAKVDLAISIMNKADPNLSEKLRMMYLPELMKALNVLLENPLRPYMLPGEN